jgi:Domain of unknown function (DUF4411)
MMLPYIVDTNFFIEAHRRSYPLDVFPSFWDKVSELAITKQICSIDRVKKEIFRNEDGLKIWSLSKLPDYFWHSSAHTVLGAYPQVIGWAASKLEHPYSQTALDEFLHSDEADAWLVAYALDLGKTLVTNEIAAPDSKKKVKIPDACNAFRVRHISPIVLFRELGVKI